MLLARAFEASSTFAGIVEASPMATPASDRPIIIAMLPVTVGGRILSMIAFLDVRMIRPAAMDTNPDMTIPNWAIEILSFSDMSLKAVALIIDAIAAMYEKLDP